MVNYFIFNLLFILNKILFVFNLCTRPIETNGHGSMVELLHMKDVKRSRMSEAGKNVY